MYCHEHLNMQIEWYMVAQKVKTISAQWKYSKVNYIFAPSPDLSQNMYNPEQENNIFSYTAQWKC